MSESTPIFDLVHLLSGRRRDTVAEMAGKLDVSKRSVFRYLADLQKRHVPIYQNENG